MNELVYLKNDEAVCSSLQVAEKFEKRHANVMRAIDSLVKKTQLKIAFSVLRRLRIKTHGKSNKSYVMNREGFYISSYGIHWKES